MHLKQGLLNSRDRILFSASWSCLFQKAGQGSTPFKLFFDPKATHLLLPSFILEKLKSFMRYNQKSAEVGRVREAICFPKTRRIRSEAVEWLYILHLLPALNRNAVVDGCHSHLATMRQKQNISGMWS